MPQGFSTAFSHSLPMPVQSKSVIPSAGLSLAPVSSPSPSLPSFFFVKPTSGQASCDVGQPNLGLEQHLELVPNSADSRMRTKEEELESKSISSDNQDGGSGEEQEMAGPRRSKKRYHRHTQHQIQEMERVFKECPHPDEKARLELSKELNLDPRQVKFWFQNKRTQMKAQQERMDNSYLRNENEKLKSENAAFRDAMKNVLCSNCGGSATNNDDGISEEEERLRMENASLKEEVSRLSAVLQSKQLLTRSNPISSPPSSSTELGLNNITLSLSELAAAGPSVAEIASRPLCLTDTEKHMVVELAVSAMEELAQVAQAGEPLWVSDVSTGCDLLNQQEYAQQCAPVIGSTPYSLKVEASRQVDMVAMNGPSLVETLMDVDRWMEMFSFIISKAQVVEELSSGATDQFDGAMQLVYAELQLPSPFVPTREAYFLRYSKRMDYMWIVVDVAVDSLRGNPPPSLLRCRKRPSGCLIEETVKGYSKVTWVEHMEVEDVQVHPSYQALVGSGMGFGAQRWLASLQRQCGRLGSFLASTPFTGRDAVLMNPEGRRSILKLAERMSNNFCSGVNASPTHMWITLSSGGRGGVSFAPTMATTSGGACEECRVVIRKSVDDPGRPPGIVLSAATSFWLPVAPARIFQFLLDERYRTEWDILSNMGVVEEMVRVPKGHNPGNSVSLLKVNASNANQNNMLILQDCCTDKSCSLVIHAPVDVSAMGAVLNGGDPNAVLLLPSGFAILPDGRASRQSQTAATSQHHDVPLGHFLPSSGGSLLTVAFQILVDHTPTAKLSLESVATVNNLISSTVLRIKSALSVERTPTLQQQ